MEQSKEKIKEFVLKDGGYQDIEINGKIFYRGWRNCDDRWSLIKDYIGTGKSVIDFGSHYGYFSKKIADAGNVVLSIEGGKERAEIQRLMLEANKTKGVYLINKTFNLHNWFDLMRTAEMIDCIVALSVMHYIEPKELFDTLWVFSQISPNLIIEYPTLEETTTASYEYVKGFGDFFKKIRCFYDEIKLIGNVISSSDKQKTRPIYFCSNKKIYRNGVLSYLSHNIAGRKHTVKYENGKWTMDNRTDLVAGFNYRTVLEYANLEYPNNVKEQCADAYLELIKEYDGNITDINLRNVVLTYNGVKIIDYSEEVGNDIYGLKWKEYLKKTQKMTKEELLIIFNNLI